LWRSEIHLNLKIGADALSRRRRRYCVCRKIYDIHQGEQRQYAGMCACAYGVCSEQNKSENETNITTLLQPNLF